MGPPTDVTFGRFRFDLAGERVWEGSRTLTLRPKAFAILRYLIARPGELVTKQELLEAVWPSTFIADGVLKESIRQLRDALGDDPAAPQYIETAHRRGYRFVGRIDSSEPTPRRRRTDVEPQPATGGPTAPETTPCEVTPPELSSSQATSSETAAPETSAPEAVTPDVPAAAPPRIRERTEREADAGVLGREAELAQLREWLTRALRGERQIAFVTGEPGIGKTTIVNELIAQAARIGGIWIARGQCLEHYGAGEAYLPVLDALSRLGKTSDGPRLIAQLRQHAPAWLQELPSLVPAGERDALRQQVAGASATRERMLREITEAIDAITAEAPLILLLEDLHWSDYSTLDLLAYLARRRDPARLMVIGTYRPVEVILGDHPLKGVKRELQAHRLCQELPLTRLTEPAVAEYLGTRLPGGRFPRRLARLVHRRTDGNPLFMVNLVSYLLDEQVLVERHGAWRVRDGLDAVESSVPESVRQLIERQIERLGADERRVLEGAAVVGMECSSIAIAAGLDEPATWVEECCEALVRKHQFLSPGWLVELPDGRITARYRFNHVLYLDVPYQLMPAMERSRIHGRIGRCGEQVYATRLEEIATELAMHFEQGHDRPRAVRYLLMSAGNAVHRSANHEAEDLARRGLRALEALPDSPERAAQEYRLLMILGAAMLATKGVAAEGLEATCTRAFALCPDPASPEAFMARWMLGLGHFFRGELRQALAIAEQLLALGTAKGDRIMLIEGHRAVGVTLVEMGRFRDAMTHFDQLAPLYEQQRREAPMPFVGHDPQVVGHGFAARAAWALGDEAQALDRISRALALARELSHAESLVFIRGMAGMVHYMRGDAARMQEEAELAIALADEYGMEMWVAFGNILRGWAVVTRGGIDEGLAELRRGLSAFDATGVAVWRPFFLGLLADALGRAGRAGEGASAAAEAAAEARATGADGWLAELDRLHGELARG